MKRVRLAIVDDAHFIRAGLRRLFENDHDIEVVGAAASGEELLAHVETWRPDVVTLDLNMPGLGGMGTLDRLLAARTLPVIILSTHSGAGAPLTVEALSRGAVDCVNKEAFSLVDFSALRSVLREKILHVAGPRPAKPTIAHSAGMAPPCVTQDVEIVVIGASTGGPRAVEHVLRALGPDLAVPVIVAQHMPAGFTQAFAQRLDRVLPLTVREAASGSRPQAGTVWIAPAGKEARVVRHGRHVEVEVREAAPQVLYRPSVDALFRSTVHVYGGRVAAALLTGMGDDGARGLAELRNAGAFTVAQDETTSVVWGMPRVAAALGAAQAVLPLPQIGLHIRALVTGTGRPDSRTHGVNGGSNETYDHDL